MPKKERFDNHHAGGGFITQPSIKNCYEKKSYKTKALANKEKKRARKENGWDLSVYRCNVCQQYHLTTRTKNIGVSNNGNG